MKELIQIQSELKVKKKRLNTYAKKPFYYRNCEDILEALKPVLKKHRCSLVIDDQMVNMCPNFYLQSKVSLYRDDGTLIASSCGMAREIQQKTGMDSSQLTGTASSYARKMALGGLFLIDDGNDADSHDNTSVGEQKQKTPQELEAERQDLIKKARKAYKAINAPSEELQQWIAQVDTYDANSIVKGMNKIQKLIQQGA
jgi:hypothetical protein